MYLLLLFLSSLSSSNTRSSDIKQNIMHIIQIFRAYYLSDCISDYRRPWSERTHHVQIIPGCYTLHAWRACEGMLDFCWRSIRIWHRTIEGASCIAVNCISGIGMQSRLYRRDNIVDMNMVIQVRNFNFTAISNECILAWPWYVYPTWWRWFYYFIIILAFPADIGKNPASPLVVVGNACTSLVRTCHGRLAAPIRSVTAKHDNMVAVVFIFIILICQDKIQLLSLCSFVGIVRENFAQYTKKFFFLKLAFVFEGSGMSEPRPLEGYHHRLWPESIVVATRECLPTEEMERGR